MPSARLKQPRNVQESLHNSAKHSGAQHVEVELWGTPDEIHLVVSDSGSGFDSEGAKQSQGLGFISMEERLTVLKETFSIESQAKRGTKIHARVPLGSPSDSMRAAGQNSTPVNRITVQVRRKSSGRLACLHRGKSCSMRTRRECPFGIVSLAGCRVAPPE
jgi:hypothetical protein